MQRYSDYRSNEDFEKGSSIITSGTPRCGHSDILFNQDTFVTMPEIRTSCLIRTL